MRSHRPVRTALAVLLGASLAAPTVGAAPASISADLAAQSGHHTGKASLDGAVVVRRDSFLRAGIAFDANGTCENPGMMLPTSPPARRSGCPSSIATRARRWPG